MSARFVPPGLRRPVPPKGRTLGSLSENQRDPRRPLMARHENGYVEDGGRTRLIGLEIRLRDAFGMQEEVQMIPLDIELPKTCNAALTWQFGPCTLHTSAGDATIPAVSIPPSGF